MNETTPLWSDEQLKLIAFDTATHYLMDKSEGKATPLTQLIHKKLVEMRDSLSADHAALTQRVKELELENERLTAAADPEALTIVYGKGRASGQEDCRKRIAELEAQLSAATRWEPVEEVINGGDRLIADEIAVTIAYDDLAVGTFEWPEDGSRYAVCRVVGEDGNE